MTIIQRTIPKAIKVAGVAGFAGLGIYCTKQFSTAFAESNEPKSVFSGLGFTTLRLQSTKNDAALLAITHPGGSWLPTIRPYTPISDLDEPGHIELMVKKYPDGKASGYLHSLRPGDSLTFATSLKGYQWKQNELSHAYLLAGGAGITPIYQLIKGILKDPQDRTKLTLIFGVNSEEDLLLKEEFDRYATEFPDRFNYIYTVSRPKEENSPYRTGYIDEELLESTFKESTQNTKVFICGPPAMEDSLVGTRRSPEGILSRLGFSKDQSFVYRYASDLKSQTTVPGTAKMSGQTKSLYPEPNVLSSSLKVGAVTGSAGLIYGGISGVIRSPHPVIHSISCGIHWFACGASFWWLRSNILKLHYEDKATPKQRAYVSALSGGVAGGAVTRLMGGRLVPGLVVFSLLGYVGQSSYNAIDTWQMENANTTSKPFLQRMADSKWIPLKSLSDDDYRGILNEKVLSIEAEIALIDDKIGELEKLKTSGLESGNSDPAAK
ncbi:NADH-cytochrome B5 reductase [Aspergillus eucalypticola CBS 122712]|uniref:NADH-cytochrome B5 reductase n=1 Tax=Aspergillus eucalypticola (strain CBS 122712 / IBT 29274) TaxID=1448314 RepID=A0A317UQS4_ASPEC|nr:NADH-cytochrome B5 reductase [Aspergillus eucalypticola CBS 122712]PWY63596.1 NADH-cytochrome B5 reductase [Aspergillus eucalypticola CBS 122712]